MPASRPSKILHWCLFLLFCAIWFYMLGARTLVPTDEGRYAEMAREMAVSGDWITPRLNGIKYFEKPPLQTWMNALTFRALGLGEWQARLWTGLCGLFGILLTAYTGRRVFSPRVGLYAGLVLASSFLWAAMSHINTLDMGLAAMMTLTLCALLLAQHPGASATEHRYWMLACWSGMALAVLSKGLIGIVLPAGVLALYVLATRNWALLKRLQILIGLPLFLAITAPWFILVSLKNPEFPYFFFIHEHFQRFTSTVHHREGAWHYFIPILLLGILPWIGLMPQSLWNARRQTTDILQPRILLLLWTVLIFVFFSISGSKLPSYILPIFPAMALLIACHLEHASPRSLAFSAGLIALCSAVGLGFTHRIPALASNAYEQPLYLAYTNWVIAAAAVGLVGGLCAVLMALRLRRTQAIAMLAATGFLSGQIIMLGHEPLGRYKAGSDHVPAILAIATPETPIYSVGKYEQTMPFYLQRTLILVGNPDEMDFGLQHEPHLWLPTLDAFIKKWHAQSAARRKAIAIIPPALLPELENRGIPLRIISQDPRRAIITNN